MATGRRVRLKWVVAAIVLLLAVAGGALWWVLSDRSAPLVNPAPPRLTAAAQLPSQGSTIVVPISTGLDVIEAELNRAIPTTLWQIDQREAACIPGQRVTICPVPKRECKNGKCRKVGCKFGLERTKVTPDIACRIVGNARRGPIRLSGSGETLMLHMPVRATVQVRDLGGVIRQETATGAADVRAQVRLGLARDWSPTARVEIGYGWSQAPGIDILGRRIRFTGKADEKLAPVIAGLERSLPGALAQLKVRSELDGLWRQGFTAIELNRDKPPAWMRITPQRMGFGGYRVQGRTLELTLAAEALTETFIGDRPSDPVATPLPPAAGRIGDRGLRFFIPVLADYAQLEPVVERALTKLARKGVSLEGVGPIDAQFGKVTIYATDGGRLAVGVQARADARNTPFGAARGVVWLWGTPYNEPGSQLVKVRDLSIATGTDSRVVNLLVPLFADEQVLATIRDALSHDFGKDYARVLAAARRAVAERREGDFLLSAQIRRVTNGTIRATGQGLFMPVEAEGVARIRYAPVRR